MPAGFAAIPRAARLQALLPIFSVLILLIGICVIAIYLGFVTDDALSVASQDELIDTATSDLRDQLLRAETSERGFLITGRAIYLAPFHDAVAAAQTAFDTSERLTRDRPSRHLRIAALHAPFDRIVAEMSRTIALAQSGDRSAALDLVNSDIGLQLSNELLQRIGALHQDLRSRRAANAAGEARTITLLMLVVGLSAIGALVAAATAASMILRQLRLLLGREAELDALVDNLETRVASRTLALEEATTRFEIATTSAGVTVFSQDLDLKYVWISRSIRNWDAQSIIGRTDADLVPPSIAAELERAKRTVLATDEPAHLQVHLPNSDKAAWFNVSLVPSHDQAGHVIGLVGGAVDITSSKEAEAHIRLLMRELAHRSKNLLAVVVALTRQTAATTGSPAEFAERLTARLQGLSASNDLLIDHDWHGTTIHELIRSQLAHYDDQDRLEIDPTGPRVKIPADAAQNLGMALHELATNAAKYGALSGTQGRVVITWSLAPGKVDGTECTIAWRESGGPTVTPPRRRGFGQVVIERTVARALRGNVTLAYKPTGVEWTITFPLEQERREE